MRTSCLGLTLALSVAAVPASWADDGTTLEPSPLEIHGFASQGFLVTSANNYLANTERGSFEFAEAGLNVTRSLGDRLRTGIQLFARDLGPIGDYKVSFDWFYLDYRWQDWLGFRAGRLKLPFGLYNDTADIDAAHSVALLPQSLYPARNRDFLLAQTGVEVYGYRELGSAGALDYRAYVGTIFIEVDAAASPITVVDVTIPYVTGGRLLWELPVDGLRVGGSAQVLRLDTDLLAPGPVSVSLPAVLWTASAEYALDELLFAAEYSQWHVDVDSTDPMTYPESHSVSKRGYGLFAYQILPWLQPGAYYSVYYPDVKGRTGRASRQHDAAVTVRIDVNQNWMIKLEGHYLRGTAALQSGLNDGRPTGELTNHWGLLVAKTTAYF